MLINACPFLLYVPYISNYTYNQFLIAGNVPSIANAEPFIFTTFSSRKFTCECMWSIDCRWYRGWQDPYMVTILSQLFNNRWGSHNPMCSWWCWSLKVPSTDTNRDTLKPRNSMGVTEVLPATESPNNVVDDETDPLSNEFYFDDFFPPSREAASHSMTEASSK